MVVLGIDVGKRELFVSLQETQSGMDVWVIAKRGPIANTAAGLHDLTTWLQKRTSGDVQVVMEAPTVYWERCAHHFHAQGVAVSVVNPDQIKYFARSVLRRGKTDAMDAEIIARYGLVMQPGCWAPPSTTLNDLKHLTRERESVLGRRTRENNHLIALRDAHHASAVVVTLAAQRLELLDRQLVALDEALHTLVNTDQELQQQLKLLLTVPGFAFISAVTILAETAGFSRLSTGAEISAAAGMAPSPQQSGSKTGRGSISKTGNARLRRIAYLCALGAAKSNSRLKIFYEQLKARGKPPKVALTALGRKLLCIGLAVVKSGTPYQDDFGPCNARADGPAQPAILCG